MRELLVFLAAFTAGAVNAVAGGGTLITFPTLIGLGVPSVVANVTSSVALWPGLLGGVWGYRRQLADTDQRVFALMLPSVIGGVLGGILLLLTPTRVFDRLVPFLILFATGLFMANEPIQRLLKPGSLHPSGSYWLSWTVVFQFAVALYGGYFGAGVGILMLAALGLMGHTDIHRMNAVKNVLSACCNGAAAIYFAFTADVIWLYALLMAVGAIAGGAGGAGLALRIGPVAVRRIVVLVGLASSLALLVARW